MKKIVNTISLAIFYLLFVLIVFTTCKKNKNDVNKIGGFNSSSEIHPESLKAYWTFDGTPNENISSITPTTNMGSSFVPGVKGQAIHFKDGYLLFPNFPSVNGPVLGSITVSCWIKVDNNGVKDLNVFSLTMGTSAQTDWSAGFINMGIDTHHPTSSDDTLLLHSSFSTYPNTVSSRISGDNLNENGIREIDYKTVHGTNKWVHYVCRYEAIGSNFDIFANGILVSNKNLRHKTTGTPPTGLGELVTCGCPSQVLIGAFANTDSGFPNSATLPDHGFFNGSIDEIRFYTTALKDEEINALYQLELAGR